MPVGKSVNKIVNYVNNVFFSMFILKGFDTLAVCFCCPLFNKEITLGNSRQLVYVAQVQAKSNGVV